jgi:hypothetical protein
MKLLLLFLAVLAISAIYAYLKLQKKPVQASSYKRRRPLNTMQQAMYWRLVKMLPDYVVLPQVAMSRCVGIRGPALDILCRKSLDFVICDKAMQIVAVIELENRNKPSADRNDTDRIKVEAIGMAGIRLIKWPARPLPSEAFIVMEFTNQLMGDARLAA